MMKTDFAPNFKRKWIGGVGIYWCKHLNQGGIGNSTTDEDDDIYGIYPLSLLWDQIKEYGINNEDEDEI